MTLSTVSIVITFVTTILIISSSQISFARENNKEEVNDNNIHKDTSVSSSDKTRDSKEKTEVQNDILNNHYPNQYYFCGYPQRFEKVNCN